MTAQELLRRLDSPASETALSLFYKDPERSRQRAKALVRGLAEHVSDGETVRLFSAPGRTELGGNHTDHNRGRVLAASIQLDILAAVSPRKDKKVFFRSSGFDDVELDLSDLGRKSEEEGSTRALIRGVAAAFATRGIETGGFTGNAESLVLPGSGLSSSAAVEVLIASIFDRLFGGGRQRSLEIAKIGQWAENEYFGKPSGLMDQAACASGGAVAIDLKDIENPKVKVVPFNPEAAGFALCVVDTRGSHAGLTPDYAAIPDEMKAVAGFFGKTVLRETSLRAVLEHCAELRAGLGDRAVLRALHFFAENDRVPLMTRALEALNAEKDRGAKGKIMDRFLNLVNQSGSSSCMLLQNIYAAGKPREQGISLALALTRIFLETQTAGQTLNGACHGACRVHGGGFAGTIQAYIPLESLPAYTENMETVFGRGALTPLAIRPVGAAEIELPA
ncbi:MAG: galactokinase [Spirochaetaceae bacterium]|jgi:galactokinase|nr:galactokinase [Spirochaetaceae bacterium]